MHIQRKHRKKPRIYHYVVFTVMCRLNIQKLIVLISNLHKVFWNSNLAFTNGYYYISVRNVTLASFFLYLKFLQYYDYQKQLCMV